MKDSEQPRKKHSQCDYNLGFKLAVISQVEKGELIYTSSKDIWYPRSQYSFGLVKKTW